MPDINGNDDDRSYDDDNDDTINDGNSNVSKCI